MDRSLLVHELVGVLVISAVAIGVLVLAEVLKRTTSLPTEHTRKFAHIGSGVAVLLIPVVITSSWTVLLLAAAFAALMLGTHATGLLEGVHGVGRGVGGVLWYPITAWLTFFVVFDLRDGAYLEYAIPILVLACADAMGAVVGRRWGRHRYEVVPGHYRSWEGSAAFFAVALVVIVAPLTLGLGVPIGEALGVGVMVAALATAYESVSVHGLDNVLVPLGTLLLLDHYLALDAAQLALQAALILAIIGATLALRWRRPATAGGGVAFVLSVYTVLVLGGWAWVPPLVGIVVVFTAYERLTPVPGRLAKQRYELGTTVIGLTVPVALVLAYAAVDDPGLQHALYVGYLASIACQAAVMGFLLPQHRSFRWRRVRRAVTVRDPWQHAPTAGKLAFAASAVAIAVAVPIWLGSPTEAARVPAAEVALLLLACATGLAAFVTIAATRCARRACAACGNVTLHGMGCCHDLGVGDTVSLGTLTFRKTYLLANLLAASGATVVVATWT